MLKPARHIDQLIRTRLELVADVRDEQIKIAVSPDDGGKSLPGDRLRRREDRRLDSHHEFRPAHRSGKIQESRSKPGFGLARRP
jgi:hypothetical protein